MDQGTDRGYFPNLTKYLFIADSPVEKEAAKGKFDQTGLNINYVDVGRCLGAYLVLRE